MSGIKIAPRRSVPIGISVFVMGVNGLVNALLLS
jgi:hypothetical protein